MTQPDPNKLKALVRAMSLAGNFGLSVGVVTFLGVLAGNYLDERFGKGKGFIFAGVLLLDVGVGLYSAIHSLSQALKNPETKREGR